uniref:Cation/H+ exchanger transmembrane domain-containing protein n=1 Tax=Spongospora subterranea TaxID=70186 RepID=A0A0H5QUE8_9EUKA|eukprot:CRZ05196.1 hypothetical protein [Spongospora subterranea]
MWFTPCVFVLIHVAEVIMAQYSTGLPTPSDPTTTQLPSMSAINSSSPVQIFHNNSIAPELSELELLQKQLSESLFQIEKERQSNVDLAKELSDLKMGNAAADAKLIDYDTGMVQLKNGSLESITGGDEKAVDPALLQESPTFVADLVCLLIAATIAAAVAEYYRLPVFLGFIIGGMLVGPSGLNFLHPSNVKYIDSLAQAGISLLLFESGVSFGREKNVERSYRMTIFAFLMQFLIIIMLVPTVISRFITIHASFQSTIIFALCMSLSSSNSIWELKHESSNSNQKSVRMALAIVSGQDLFMGFLLCLPDALYFGPLGVFIVMKQLIYGAALAFSSVWFSRRILPQLMHVFLDRPASKLFLLSILSLCTVFSAVSTLTGLSTEFGAMTAGMTLSNSDLGKTALTKLRPLSHLFSGILFASIGMLLSPRFILTHLGTLCVTLLFVVLVKFLSGFVVAHSLGQSRRCAMTIGLSISTVAEFSMILAAKGYQLEIISRSHYLHVLAVTFLSFVISPMIYQFSSLLHDSDHNESPVRRRSSGNEDEDKGLDEDAPILIHRL